MQLQCLIYWIDRCACMTKKVLCSNIPAQNMGKLIQHMTTDNNIIIIHTYVKQQEVIPTQHNTLSSHLFIL